MYVSVPPDPACTDRDFSHGTDLFLSEIKTLITLQIIFSFFSVITKKNSEGFAVIYKGLYLNCFI